MEGAVRGTNLGAVFPAGAALDVGLPIGERDRRGVPARAVHVPAPGQAVVARAENVGVVVSRVGRLRPGPVVAAGDEDISALRQEDLSTTEDVGLSAVRQ